MPVHTYNAAMTCGGCSGAITRILTKQLQEGEKFDVSKFTIMPRIVCTKTNFRPQTGTNKPRIELFILGQSRSKDCQS